MCLPPLPIIFIKLWCELSNFFVNCTAELVIAKSTWPWTRQPPIVKNPSSLVSSPHRLMTISITTSFWLAVADAIPKILYPDSDIFAGILLQNERSSMNSAVSSYWFPWVFNSLMTTWQFFPSIVWCDVEDGAMSDVWLMNWWSSSSGQRQILWHFVVGA